MTRTTELPLSIRILWIAVRLLCVLWIGERGLAFYYQGF